MVKSAKIIWSSANKKVVTVKDGLLTAVGSGMAEVTASCGDKKAVCTVTVSKPAVKITGLSQEIFVGDNMQLKSICIPGGQTISWKSKDASVCTVDKNGNVKALKAGNTEITASFSYDGKKYEDTFTFTVAEPELELSVTEMSLYIGASRKISVSGMPKGVSLSWSSDDETVASVRKGTVSGESEGMAMITASYTYNGKKYSKSLSVSVARDGIELSAHKISSFISEILIC